MSDEMLSAEIERLRELRQWLHDEKREQYDQSVSFGDLVGDRWQRAKSLGWGEGSNVFDNCVVIGDVAVGKNTFVGPNTYLDGSGGLEIGDNVTIGVAVMIATHTAVFRVLTGGKSGLIRKSVSIGSRTFVGPASFIEMGVSIGDCCVINAHSVIKQGMKIPSNSIVHGNPARIIGEVVFDENGDPDFRFNKEALKLYK